MAFVLKVIGGVDEGKTFRLQAGDNLVGRSPSAQVVTSRRNGIEKYMIAASR